MLATRRRVGPAPLVDFNPTLSPFSHVPFSMRLRPLSLALAAGSALLYLSSYSTGPAARGVDATPSGLGRTCAGCHSGGNFGTNTSITLLDADGGRVGAYVPGETYTLRINIATANDPGGYGFQILAVDSENVQAGVYGQPPADTRTPELTGRTYFEHRRRLTSSTHEIAWIAPPAGTGTVTFYGVGNAVDGTGGTGGDETDEAIVRVGEQGASATAELAWPAAVRVLSPGAGRLEVLPKGADRAAYTVQLVGMDGRGVASRRVLAQAPLAYGGLVPGIYVLRLTDASGAVATRLVPVLH